MTALILLTGIAVWLASPVWLSVSLSPLEFRIDFVLFGITVGKKDKMKREPKRKEKQTKDFGQIGKYRRALKRLAHWSVLAVRFPDTPALLSQTDGEQYGYYSILFGILFALPFASFYRVEPLESGKTVLRLKTRFLYLILCLLPLLRKEKHYVGKSNE